MIDVKEAVHKAIEYFTDLFGTGLGVQLEEVELTDDGKHWLITLSYLVNDYPDQQALTILISPPRKKKEYKIFKVDTDTGEVRSMKIRKVA